MSWQPIKTAPFNKWLIVRVPSGLDYEPFLATSGRLQDDIFDGPSWQGPDDATIQPTHWMPLHQPQETTP